jgi:hypothetical protein
MLDDLLGEGDQGQSLELVGGGESADAELARVAREGWVRGKAAPAVGQDRDRKLAHLHHDGPAHVGCEELHLIALPLSRGFFPSMSLMPLMVP